MPSSKPEPQWSPGPKAGSTAPAMIYPAGTFVPQWSLGPKAGSTRVEVGERLVLAGPAMESRPQGREHLASCVVDDLLCPAAMESRPEGREHTEVMKLSMQDILPQWSPGPNAGRTRNRDFAAEMDLTPQWSPGPKAGSTTASPPAASSPTGCCNGVPAPRPGAPPSVPYEGAGPACRDGVPARRPGALGSLANQNAAST